MQSNQDKNEAKLNSVGQHSPKKIDAQELMQPNKDDMQQLREQLRLRGQPLTNAVLEIKVIPDTVAPGGE